MSFEQGKMPYERVKTDIESGTMDLARASIYFAKAPIYSERMKTDIEEASLSFEQSIKKPIRNKSHRFFFFVFKEQIIKAALIFQPKLVSEQLPLACRLFRHF